MRPGRRSGGSDQAFDLADRGRSLGGNDQGLRRSGGQHCAQPEAEWQMGGGTFGRVQNADNPPCGGDTRLIIRIRGARCANPELSLGKKAARQIAPPRR